MPKFEEDLCFYSSSNKSGHFKAFPKSRKDSTGLDILSVKLLNASYKNSNFLFSGESCSIAVKIFSHMIVRNVIFSVLIKELSGESETVLHLSSDKELKFFKFDAGKKELRINFVKCALKPGLYTAKIYLHQKPFYMLDAVESFIFKVKSKKDMNQCLFFQDVNWINL
jgi:lipopolysaccharide transport system ATP-binding protein